MRSGIEREGVTRRLVLYVTVISFGALWLSEGHAQAGLWLVTSSEAALPLWQGNLTGRCITRGPAVRHVSPRDTVKPGQPFLLKIDFAARRGEKIDAASVQVTLLRGDTIDITPRLRPYISASGIDVPDAMVPAGRHVLQIAVSDAGCHRSSGNIEIEAR